MRDTAVLGPWVRRFLLEHLVAERNLARNTQVSYRDSLTLLLPFVGHHAKSDVDRLLVEDISADRVRAFLEHLEPPRVSRRLLGLSHADMTDSLGCE